MPEEYIEFIRVKTKDDFDKAHKIIEDMYSWRGYQTSKLESDDDSATFISKDGESVIGTITVWFNNNLPSGHHKEIQTLINNGCNICELGRLAIFQSSLDARKFTALLFSIVYMVAFSLSADKIVMEVNPRHEKYYQKMLGFKTIKNSFCERVGAESVLMVLDVDHITNGIINKPSKTAYQSTPHFEYLENHFSNVLSVETISLPI